MQRPSQQDTEGVTWQTVGVPLGTRGLDLREPADPDTLTQLLNARFIDERTLRPRDGHLGHLVQDGSNFAPLGQSYLVGDEWVYGHGTRVSMAASGGWENAHHPIPLRGHTTFRYRGADVFFTGDRLLTVEPGTTDIGASGYWDRHSGTGKTYGVPAFLPVQVDGTPPHSVTGEYVETVLTPSYRVFVDNSSGGVNVVLLDRNTQAIIDSSEVSGASNDPVEVRVVNSGGTPVVLWRDFTDGKLYLNWWTGRAWNGASVVAVSVLGFDVATVPGGFHLLYRNATPDLIIGKYLGPNPQNQPYPFGTTIATTSGGGTAIAGSCAIGVAPNGGIGVAYLGTSLHALTLAFDLSTSTAWVTIADGTSTSSGLSICSRGLKESAGTYDWVVHYSGTSSGNRYAAAATFNGATVYAGVKRWNSRLASKSFRVGDEVFCWYRTSNAGTHYLVSGATAQTVCGFADREEALTRTVHDNNYVVPAVQSDPLDDTGTLFTWCRFFNTGQGYVRGGNVRYGDMDFLPPTCAVNYGRSVYLSGSAVRNWDGVTLGDAGFQDYPVVAGTPTQQNAGSLTNTGTGTGVYYYRVYAVRYNARGERFESAAVSSGPYTLTSTNKQFTLTLNTLPDTNHTDVTYEVYRTEALGTTFYLEGTVGNSLSAATLTYVSGAMSDATLITQLGDSHAAGVGQLSELENWGPLGCSMLTVAGDRLWGAGGQVTPGFVQFSKLHEDGSGAGFDDLAGFQEVDTEGGSVTSVGPLNDAVVVFERDRLYVINGLGPDNYGRGAFNIPQIVLADGATTHFGTVLTQLGLLYWGVDGPRLLTTQFSVQNICVPIRTLTSTMTPTGVIASLSRQEVVWYTGDGTALLMNYLGQGARFSQWSGLPVAGCSQYALATRDGRLLTESPDAVGDDGRLFPFTLCTGNLRSEALLQGSNALRSVGLVGLFKGDHRTRFRIFFNGSPLWAEEWTWNPTGGTWNSAGTTFASLTPAAVDALKPTDHSGAYLTHKRVAKLTCHFFRVQLSIDNYDHPTMIPLEISLELGAKAGLGRVAVGTFTGGQHA